jgi:hypothetical protein
MIESEANHSRAPCVHIKNVCSRISTTPYAFNGYVHMDKFTFILISYINDLESFTGHLYPIYIF